jgi:hypothetical protein
MISRLAASSLLRSSRRCRTPPVTSGSVLRISSVATSTQSDASHNWFWLAGAAAAVTAAVATTTTTTTMVQCEEPAPLPEEEIIPDTSLENEHVMEDILAAERLPDPANEAPKKASWFGGGKKKNDKSSNATKLPEDAYENLPDHDEETDCLLCQIHRQGPCRTVWRKFEHCVKDHSPADKDGDASAKTVCDKFVAPFEACWKANVNMYTLIALDVHQEDVRALELEYSKRTDRRSWAPVIDWKVWLDFIRSKGSLQAALEDLAFWDSLDRQVPLWQRYQVQEEGDPTIIATSTVVPVAKDGLVLQVVYAFDQDDMLIGYAEYDAEYEAEQAAKEKRAAPTTQEMAISILPAMTESVRVFGLYKENPAKVEITNERQLKAFLYESPKVSPKTVAKQAKV